MIDEKNIYEDFLYCYEHNSPEMLIAKGNESLPEIKANMTLPVYAECCRLVMLAYLKTKKYDLADVWRARAYTISYLSGTPNVFITMYVSIALRAASPDTPSAGLEVLNYMEQIMNKVSIAEEGYPSKKLIHRLLHEKRAYLLAKRGLKESNPTDLNNSIAEYDTALLYIQNDKRGRIKVELGRALVCYLAKDQLENGQSQALRVHNMWIEIMEGEENSKFKTLLDQAIFNHELIEKGASADKLKFYEIV